MHILMRQIFAAVTLFVLVNSWAQADSPQTIALSKNGAGAVVLDPKNGISAKEGLNLKAGAATPIALKCDSTKKVDCNNYTLQYVDAANPKGLLLDAAKITAAAGDWSLPAGAITACKPGRVEVVGSTAALAPKPALSFNVSNPADKDCDSALTTSSANVAKDTVQHLLLTDCSRQIASELNGHNAYYDQKNNRALFIVSPNGAVLARPDAVIDENDTISVIVVGDANLLPQLIVKRTSAIRTLGTLSIVGADVDLSKTPVKAGAPQNPCESRQFELTDFAPGRGEVTISVIANQGTTTAGTFDFNVATLYSGAFSLGPMYTGLSDPSFGLANNNGNNVVTETDRGSHRVIYALIFTPYVWGKRDLEKDQSTPMLAWHRLNPMFGIVLNDVSNNAIVGFSYDLSSLVYLNFGAHFGKVRRLDPNAGLTLGGTFTGTGTTVPTQTQWKTGFFVGFSMDLRAAAKFFGFASSKS